MAKVSKIEWTDSTWNPFYGCTKVSEGCKYCYMDRWAKRTGRDPTVITRSKTTFNDPLKWVDPRFIFVCSLSDFFHEDVPEEWREEAWSIMARAPQHVYLLLTKRPENIPSMLPWWWSSCSIDYVPPSIWLGVTAENQARADERIPLLLQIPAEKHFVSVEPMLGPVNINHDWFVYSPEHGAGHIYKAYKPGINWVIVGGESGSKRIMQPNWVIALRDQCIAIDVPFNFKQWGAKSRDPDGVFGGRILEGRTWDERPPICQTPTN